MSYINSRTSRVSYIDTVNPNLYDNIDRFPSASGLVLSVSGGSNINITGTSQNPIVGLDSAISCFVKGLVFSFPYLSCLILLSPPT